MRLPVLAWSLVMVLASAVATVQATPSETDTQAAYCLGTTVVTERFLKYPELSPPDSNPTQRSSVEQLAKIERLRDYLASRKLLAGEVAPDIAGFYQKGLIDAAACLGEQVRPGSCFEECAALGSDAKISSCARNCMLPPACKQATFCRDIERRLSH